jgi:hypothetical protein
VANLDNIAEILAGAIKTGVIHGVFSCWRRLFRREVVRKSVFIPSARPLFFHNNTLDKPATRVKLSLHVNQLKGGDLVSHCLSPVTASKRTWILHLSGDRPA